MIIMILKYTFYIAYEEWIQKLLRIVAIVFMIHLIRRIEIYVTRNQLVNTYLLRYT